MEVTRSKKGIVVSHRKYILDLLKKSWMSGCKPTDTPSDPNKKLGDAEKGDSIVATQYKRLICKLIYLSHTSPNIAFSIGFVSQFMHTPHRVHLEPAYRILMYLKSSLGKMLFFKKGG